MQEEEKMREIHGHIHDEWCIHPPFFAEIDMWLNYPSDWSRTSPYPELNIPAEVGEFRDVSVTYFQQYTTHKAVVARAWELYAEKPTEFSGWGGDI